MRQRAGGLPYRCGCPGFKLSPPGFGKITTPHINRNDPTFGTSLDPSDRHWAGSCNTLPAGLLIDDRPDPDGNTTCCTESRTSEGEFTLQLAESFTYVRGDGIWRATCDIAAIDLHQPGLGYDGHVWFTCGHGHRGGVGSHADL